MTETVESEYLLGLTARWIAAVRAQEYARDDRLFADPWARQLAGPEGEAWIAGRNPDTLAAIVLRTRYFDDFLQRITRGNGIRQIVLMAAGLDTRAFRLDWPAETNIFELDQPSVLAHKESVLRAAGATAACKRHAIAADLTGTWEDALLAAGFRPEQPSGWLLEGFLFYIAEASITRLIDGVSRLAAPGSYLGFDIINSLVLTHPLTRGWVEMQAQSGAPWIGTLNDPVAFLSARGWHATLAQAGQPEINFGRWPFATLPMSVPDIPHNWLVTAEKRAA